MKMAGIFYLIRLDDACSQMNRKKWQRVEEILDKYEIKPMVGIIPHNEDSTTCIELVDVDFATKALNWQKKGWAIALHGYNHVCTTSIGGINAIHKRSEFAGLSLIEQEEKIIQGYKILIDMGLIPQYFFAPSHTYDENTLKALFKKTTIRIISDTIALQPYTHGKFTVIPCQMGRFRKLFIGGYWTFCFHPNNMTEEDLVQFETFIRKNRKQFISFNQIKVINKSRSFFELFLNWLYFAIRNR